MTQPWTIEQARQTYAIANWGEGYFDVGDAGDLRVCPRGPDGIEVSLPAVVEAACAQGARLPLLVRFADILRHRLGRLQGAFAKAMTDCDYAGGYTAVYPIKVNQNRHVVEEILDVDHRATPRSRESPTRQSSEYP